MRARAAVREHGAVRSDLEKRLEGVVKEKESAIRGQEYEKAARRDGKGAAGAPERVQKSWSESTRGRTCR